MKPAIIGQAALFPELQPPLLLVLAALKIKKKKHSLRIQQQHVLTLRSGPKTKRYSERGKKEKKP